MREGRTSYEIFRGAIRISPLWMWETRERGRVTVQCEDLTPSRPACFFSFESVEIQIYEIPPWISKTEFSAWRQEASERRQTCFTAVSIMDDIFVLELFRNTFVRTWLNLVQRVLSELLIAVGSVPLKWGLPRFSLFLSVFLSFSTICLLEHVFENTYRETLVSTCLFAVFTPAYIVYMATRWCKVENTPGK